VKRKIQYPYSEETVVSFPGICSLLSVLLAGLLLLGCEKEQKVQPQAPIVEVVEVIQKDVPVYAEWVGTLDGMVNATLRAQVGGYLIKQNYREGDFVRKGQVLFEIDPREYEAALAQEKAVLSQSNGALEQTKAALSQSKGVVAQTRAALEKSKSEVAVQDARWTTAKANLARIRPLAQQNAVSQKDLDDAIGTELSTRSAVDAAKAAVDAAQADIVAAEAQVVGAQANIAAAEARVLGSQANVEKAQLNLGFTKITSPIDGVAGMAKAQIGNLVGSGSVEELTTVSTIDPIKCYAALSEQEYMQAQERAPRQVGKVPLTLILSDGSTYPHKGEVAFADRQVDVRTGTIRVASVFPNPKNLLRPGMFSRVRAEMGIKKAALVIPQRAVTEVQGRYLVAVVNPEGKVAVKPVKVGERFGEFWVIEGLQAGEKVVAEGTQKVRDGTVVSPKPFVGEAPAEPGAAQKPETKPEVKPEAKPQSKPEKR
jgi:membrane fusion protein (multidrug efflux system)